MSKVLMTLARVPSVVPVEKEKTTFLATGLATGVFDTGHSSPAARGEGSHSHATLIAQTKPQAAAFQE